MARQRRFGTNFAKPPPPQIDLAVVGHRKSTIEYEDKLFLQPEETARCLIWSLGIQSTQSFHLLPFAPLSLKKAITDRLLVKFLSSIRSREGRGCYGQGDLEATGGGK